MATAVVSNIEPKTNQTKSTEIINVLVEKLTNMFSRKQLQKNKYFISQIKNNLEISLSAIYQQRSILSITNDQNLVLEALKQCQNLEVKQDHIIPKIEQIKNQIIVKSVNPADEKQFTTYINSLGFTQDKVVINFDLHNVLRLQFTEEADGIKFIELINKGLKFKNTDLTGYAEPENIYLTFTQQIYCQEPNKPNKQGGYEYNNNPWGAGYNYQAAFYDPNLYLQQMQQFVPYYYYEPYYSNYQNPLSNMFIRKAKEDGDNSDVQHPPVPQFNNYGNNYNYGNNQNGNRGKGNYNNNNGGNRGKGNRGGYNDYDGGNGYNDGYSNNRDYNGRNNNGKGQRNGGGGSRNQESREFHVNRQFSDDFPTLDKQDNNNNQNKQETKHTDPQPAPVKNNQSEFPSPLYLPKPKEISIQISQDEFVKTFEQLESNLSIHEQAKVFSELHPEIMEINGITKLEQSHPFKSGKIDPNLYTPLHAPSSTPKINSLQGPSRKISENQEINKIQVNSNKVE